MNTKSFSQLLQRPNTLTEEDLKGLEELLHSFPYFQAARAMHLKGLKATGSFKYNQALKRTAAHTTDRSILFDFITSEEFEAHHIADSISSRQVEPGVLELEVEEEEVRIIDNKTDYDFAKINPDTVLDPELFSPKSPLPSPFSESDTSADKPDTNKTSVSEEEGHHTLELGKPLPFSKSEKHSFTEWLKLSSAVTPIDRSAASDSANEEAQAEIPSEEIRESTVTSENATPRSVAKLPLAEKISLIDRFIQSNPRIQPVGEQTPKVNLAKEYHADREELMTETLARVYLEQKKYKKAIQAYKILSLKYPEKSGFFADQIRAIKNLKDSN